MNRNDIRKFSVKLLDKFARKFQTVQKAFKLNEIDQAVQKFEPVGPDHPFFVDFTGLRGVFQDKVVFRKLNVECPAGGKYLYNADLNKANKTFLFLAGMRGSGKTSELARYAKLLHQKDCFFVVTCNINLELNLNDVQYMDIVIYKLEKLIEKLLQTEKEKGVPIGISNSVLESMRDWFSERVNEVNRKLEAEGSVEVGVSTGENLSLLKILLGFTASIKTAFRGSFERASTIRETFKANFSDYAKKFNEFIAHAAGELSKKNLAKDILFIVDGLEQMADAETRHNIIIGESDRIRQIKANTIFTLPIELMKEEPLLRQFADDVVPFPFIKLFDRTGKKVERACEKFEEFIQKRIDRSLFESDEIIHRAIQYSGGSPRQLLHILETTNYHIEDTDTKLTEAAFESAINELSNRFARYLTEKDYELLKKQKKEFDAGYPIGFGDSIQDLLERQVIFEYNDGTDKRINPLIEKSSFYQHFVTVK